MALIKDARKKYFSNNKSLANKSVPIQQMIILL